MGQAKQRSRSADIERISFETGRSYEDAIKAFEGAIGKLDMEVAAGLVRAHAPWPQVEEEMARQTGPIGLMVFATFDQGRIASLDGPQVRCRLYLVGNPAIAAKVVRIDPRASLYVPFRVALYEQEGADGAVVSYDRPSSFLRALGNQALERFGALLDDRMDAVVSVLEQEQSLG